MPDGWLEQGRNRYGGWGRGSQGVSYVGVLFHRGVDEHIGGEEDGLYAPRY